MSSEISVGNPRYWATESDLQSNCSAFGDVLAQVMMDRHTSMSKGFAVVEMKSAEGAAMAAETESGPMNSSASGDCRLGGPRVWHHLAAVTWAAHVSVPPSNGRFQG